MLTIKGVLIGAAVIAVAGVAGFVGLAHELGEWCKDCNPYYGEEWTEEKGEGNVDG